MSRGARGFASSDSGLEMGSSQFRQLTSEVERRRTLVTAAESSSRVVLWFGSGEQRIVLRSKIHSEGELKRFLEVVIPADLDLEQWVANVTATGNRNCHIMVFTKDSGIVGFETEWLDQTEKTLRFTLPREIYKAQRRSNYRHFIPRGQDISVSIPNPRDLRHRIRRQVLDISVGGISILIPASEAHNYKIGMLVRHGFFKIRGRTLNFDGEVRAIGEVTNVPKVEGFRVGVKFRRLSKEDIEFIDMYVIENAIQYYNSPYRVGDMAAGSGDDESS